MVLVWISAVSHCERLLEDNPGLKGLTVQTRLRSSREKRDYLLLIGEEQKHTETLNYLPKVIELDHVMKPDPPLPPTQHLFS